VEELYWSNPWKYSTVSVNGNKYNVTYYRAYYKIRPNQSSPVYEYILEKSIERTKVYVYGMDMNGNRVDLGEKDVYEYRTVVTPKNAANLRDKLVIKVWYTRETGDAFVYPWEAVWIQYMMGQGAQDFVGLQLEYEGNNLTFTNPLPFQSNLFPYVEGESNWTSDISTDLSNLWIGWAAITKVGVWAAWVGKNLAIPQSGTWTDAQGHSWEWSIEPDGKATFSGMTFRLVDVQWSYSGSPEGVKIEGRAKIAPGLFLPVETEGTFSFKNENTDETTIVYGYIKVEEIKLKRIG